MHAKTVSQRKSRLYCGFLQTQIRRNSLCRETRASPVRRFLLGMILSLVALRAGAEPQALPDAVTHAHTIFLEDETGSNELQYRTIFELNKWSRFDLAECREKADLVMRLDNGSHVRVVPVGQFPSAGRVNAPKDSEIPKGHTRIVLPDPKTTAVLWSDSRRYLGSNPAFCYRWTEPVLPVATDAETFRTSRFAPGWRFFMEITVEHLGSVQFEIKTRGHSIVSDQPVEHGGFDEGMTPPELLLASLGSCAGYYAAQYLRKHKLATEGTRVRVTCEKVKDPVARLDNFVIVVDTPLELGPDHQRGVQEAVEHCLVHNTLLNRPKIALKVEGAVPAKT
jgi:putative redox protein